MEMIVLGIFIVILLIVWTLLPFAVFGTKPILHGILREMRRTNELLAKSNASKERT